MNKSSYCLLPSVHRFELNLYRDPRTFISVFQFNCMQCPFEFVASEDYTEKYWRKRLSQEYKDLACQAIEDECLSNWHSQSDGSADYPIIAMLCEECLGATEAVLRIKEMDHTR